MNYLEDFQSISTELDDLEGQGRAYEALAALYQVGHCRGGVQVRGGEILCQFELKRDDHRLMQVVPLYWPFVGTIALRGFLSFLPTYRLDVILESFGCLIELSLFLERCIVLSV